jgi:hypothetical protein
MPVCAPWRLLRQIDVLHHTLNARHIVLNLNGLSGPPLQHASELQDVRER